MIDLLTLRGLMFIEGIMVGLLFAWVFGRRFFEHGWSFRITGFGFGGLIAYATVIQVKAYKRQTPFDLYSTLGLVALTLTVTGLLLYVTSRPPADRT